jgi:hypothetical protein
MVEIRWTGDSLTEVAALAAIGYPTMIDTDDGVSERWIWVQHDRVDAVRNAITAAGGKIMAAGEA